VSTPYDPRELDLAWDSVIAGRSTGGYAGDETDRDLLALLGVFPRSAPRSEFVRTLERTLFGRIDSMNGHHATAVRPASPQNGGRQRRPFGIGD
jgi:hypothetical protein